MALAALQTKKFSSAEELCAHTYSDSGTMELDQNEKWDAIQHNVL